MLLLSRQRCYCSGSPPCSLVAQSLHNNDHDEGEGDDGDDEDDEDDEDDNDHDDNDYDGIKHAVKHVYHHIVGDDE